MSNQKRSSEVGNKRVEKARKSIERRDRRYWDFLAQTGQLAGNADKTRDFVFLLAVAIESDEV